MPANADATRQRILEEAERLFAEHGFDGVSLRTIASAAGTHLALIRYHYGSKDALYRAVWAARYAVPADKRSAALEALDWDRDREAVVLDLVILFLAPAAMMASAGGRNFMTLMARELTDRREPERGILSELVDPNAAPLLDGFRRVLPELSAAEIAWGYQAMTGVGVLHIMDVERTTRLSGGAACSRDYAAAYPHFVDFITGGWLAMARKKVKRREKKRV